MSQEYTFPNDGASALALLSGRDKAIAVAGGTSFHVAGGPPKGARLVDLTRAGLDTLRDSGDALRIGAATPVARLATDPAARPFAGGLLAEAARSIGSPQIRNLVTAGGNVIAGHAWSCLPPALLALDATLVFLGESGEVRVPYATWLAARPGDLPPLLSAIECPAAGADARSAFLTLRKSSIDFPTVTVAALAPSMPAQPREGRFAVFGCTRRPVRLPAFESAFAEAAPSIDRTERDRTLQAAAERAVSPLEIAASFRIDPDHVRAAASALLVRAALRLLEPAAGRLVRA